MEPTATGLLRQWGKCAGNSRRINVIPAELVFRGAYQKCAHHPKEISSFAPELVFRQVPGKSAQWSGQTQCLRRLRLCATLLDPIGGGVIGIGGAPLGLRLLPPRRLTLRLAAGVLTISYTSIGPEPPATDRARSLPGLGHCDSSSPPWSAAAVQFKRPGSFLESRGG